MPIKKAARKYIRITAKNTAYNKKITGSFRNAIKKTRKAATSGNYEEAKKWFKKASKSLDKAVQKKVIKKNTAARKKSRLNKIVKAAKDKK